VFHTIYGMIGDWEESQDLTQDTFHQALKGIDTARAESGSQFREKAWLMRIALNVVRMQRRRQRLFRFIPFSRLSKKTSIGEGETRETQETQAIEAGELNERAAAVQPIGYGVREGVDPADLVVERDAVQRTMARLTEPMREVLLLSIISSFSTHEIAHMLDLQEPAVRQRLARARKQFQQLYALESNEQISDNANSAFNTGSVQSDTAGIQPIHDRHVESRHDALLDNQSGTRRDYAERLYRNPAVTPLR
ncbi:MAG TPA: RNA polymerase sigma factor, partial [Ktedonobacteraceae bacterium]|nr:RNA polymerase sigma factor [Ktedonobacteraceae bacterium]